MIDHKPPPRPPHPDFEIVDPAFGQLLLGNCRVERLHTGSRWAEGPCYFADGQYLVWSDIPNDRLLRWSEGLGVEIFRQPSQYANGHTRDRQGRLVSCEHLTRRVTRTEWDGSISVLADQFEGKRLNSPNDVVVQSDGTIWFTDPPYGILSDYEGKKSPSELAGNYVFRLDPKTGSLAVASELCDRPNGLAFCPDESKLFVADSGQPQDMKVFDVVASPHGSVLDNPRVFAVCDAGVFDGFRFDQAGNLWTSTKTGVSCYALDGRLLGRIHIPEAVSNLTFGGAKRNRLFITATSSLYSVFVNATGAQVP